MVVVYSLHCLIWLANILLRIFWIYVHEKYWSIIFLSCDVFTWFYWDKFGLIEYVWKCSQCCYFLKVNMENCYIFFLKCFLEFTNKTTWAWSFLFLKFNNYCSISLVNIELLSLPISLWDLAICLFQEIGSFH